MKIRKRKSDLDLGDNHFLRFYSWKPDRKLNPQYKKIKDVERYGAMVVHLKPDKSQCFGAITFDSEASRKLDADSPKWIVESWEPLTLSPSLLCRECGDHGFIRNGKWQRA